MPEKQTAVDDRINRLKLKIFMLKQQKRWKAWLQKWTKDTGKTITDFYRAYDLNEHESSRHINQGTPAGEKAYEKFTAALRAEGVEIPKPPFHLVENLVDKPGIKVREK